MFVCVASEEVDAMRINLTQRRSLQTRRDGLMHRRRGLRRGTEVLEMALVIPILMGLAVGLVEFGFFFFLQHNAQAAAREGARATVPFGATDADGVTKANAFL